MTIKITEVSKYDTDKHAIVRKYVNEMKTNICSQSGGKPSNYTLKMVVTDKADREMFTL